MDHEAFFSQKNDRMDWIILTKLGGRERSPLAMKNQSGSIIFHPFVQSDNHFPLTSVSFISGTEIEMTYQLYILRE